MKNKRKKKKKKRKKKKKKQLMELMDRVGCDLEDLSEWVASFHEWSMIDDVLGDVTRSFFIFFLNIF